MKIIRFWGIPIYKVLSDDDYVEGIRKWLKHSKKLFLICVLFLLILCFLLQGLIQFILQLIEEIPDGEQKIAWMVIILGFIFGAIFSQCIIALVQGILVVLDLFDYNRANKLLIKYHDMLKENGLLEEEQDGQILKEGEDDRQPLCR
jgi:phosphotransferase system  glucose/maltose/N-acetylglucosamine-specific IIC component